MNGDNRAAVGDILKTWEKFKTGHGSLEDCRDKVIESQKQGIRFFDENSPETIGPAVYADRALRHELTAAEMAFRKMADENNEWIVSRSSTNPYAQHIAKKLGIETEYLHQHVPRETDVPSLTDDQKQAIMFTDDAMKTSRAELTSAISAYYKNPGEALKRIDRILDSQEKTGDLISQAGEANDFRSGLLRRVDADTQMNAREDLEKAVDGYDLVRKETKITVDSTDAAFRNSLGEVPIEEPLLTEIARSEARPTEGHVNSAKSALTDLKSRYEQSDMVKGAGLTFEASNSIRRLFQNLPSVIARPLRTEPDLRMEVETSLTSTINDLSKPRLDVETAYGVLESLNYIASEKNGEALVKQATSNGDLAKQAQTLDMLLRDRTPDLRIAIERSDDEKHFNLSRLNGSLLSVRGHLARIAFRPNPSEKLKPELRPAPL